MEQNKNKIIIDQVEFYFSDANIVRDEYLKRVLLANDGWVPLNVINSFGKIQLFKKTVKELEDILKESTKLVVKQEKIQRNTPIPTYQEHNGEEKTILIRNFPCTYTLEDIQKVLEAHKDRIARIAMRKDSLKEFKGSAFVELNEKEDIEIIKDSKLVIEVPIVVKENDSVNSTKKTKIELEVVSAKEYFDKKKKAKKEEKEKKQQKAIKAIVDTFKNKIFKFSVAKGENEAAKDEIDLLKISDIKQALQKGVAFVDIPNRHVRMSKDEDNVDPIEVNGLCISFSKLTDEEVDKYCDGLSLISSTKKFTKPRKKNR